MEQIAHVKKSGLLRTERSFGIGSSKPFRRDVAATLEETLRTYNQTVARGWESKSVEAQQAEAGEKSANTRPVMSAQEAAVWREKESIRLSRQRVLQQLEASTNPRHRKLLEDALADLDAKLGK